MRVLLFIITCLVSMLSQAQVQDSIKTGSENLDKRFKPIKLDPKIKYKTTVISVPYRKVRDEGHSPLTHRGPSIQVAAYKERWRTKKGITKSITKFEMVLGVGLIKTNKKAVSSVTQAPTLYMEINYHYMRPVRKILNGKGDWYLGGILTNTFDGRYYIFLPNNSFGYEFSNALNPATHISYDFNYGKYSRQYQVGFKLNFALLAHVVRPNFIGMEPSETYMYEEIKPFAILTHGNQIVLPNRFLRVNTETYLDIFKRKNKDKYRIFYGWGLHITRLKQANPLYVASHTLGIAVMLYSEKERKIKTKKGMTY